MKWTQTARILQVNEISRKLISNSQDKLHRFSVVVVVQHISWTCSVMFVFLG